jgi:cytochrome c556
MRGQPILLRAVACALAAAAAAAQQAPKEGPGWTGLTRSNEVIAARQALMMEIERLMRPVDTYAAGEPATPASIREAAIPVAAMLRVVPHLFPPTTNVYSDDPATPTLALPPIWEDFESFERVAAASLAAAEALAAAPDGNALRTAAQALRATCDACHARFLRPYVPEGVSSEDLDFDFESVLPKD